MFPVAVTKAESLKTLLKEFRALQKPRKFLAGGTDLCVVAGHGHGVPCNWLDISRVPELRRIEIKNKTLFVGAAVKIAELGANKTIAARLPALCEAAGKFASPPLRNMATIGGNCANASPSADGVCALVAEEAVAVVISSGKVKRIPVEDIAIGPKKTILKEDELITGFEFPVAKHYGAYCKLAARDTFAISKVSVAAAVWLDKLGRIENARIALGAVAPKIIRAVEAETQLLGNTPGKTAAKKAASAAAAAAIPIDDQRSLAEYRKAMVEVLAERCLDGIFARINGELS